VVRSDLRGRDRSIRTERSCAAGTLGTHGARLAGWFDARELAGWFNGRELAGWFKSPELAEWFATGHASERISDGGSA
jgi:hypothetical protein